MVPGGIPGRTPGQDARWANATIGRGYNGKGWCWAQWGEGERERERQEWVGPGNTNPSQPRLSEFLPATAAGLSLLHSFLLQQKSVVLAPLFPNVVIRRSPNLLLEKCFFSALHPYTQKQSRVPLRSFPSIFLFHRKGIYFLGDSPTNDRAAAHSAQLFRYFVTLALSFLCSFSFYFFYFFYYYYYTPLSLSLPHPLHSPLLFLSICQTNPIRSQFNHLLTYLLTYVLTDSLLYDVFIATNDTSAFQCIARGLSSLLCSCLNETENRRLIDPLYVKTKTCTKA